MKSWFGSASMAVSSASLSNRLTNSGHNTKREKTKKKKEQKMMAFDGRRNANGTKGFQCYVVVNGFLEHLS